MDVMSDFKTKNIHTVQVSFTNIGTDKEWSQVMIIGSFNEYGKAIPPVQYKTLLGHPCIIKLDGYQHHLDSFNKLDNIIYGVILDQLCLLTRSGILLRVIEASNLEMMSAMQGEIAERIMAFKQYEKEAQLP